MVRLPIRRIDQPNALSGFSVPKEGSQTQTWNCRKRKKMGLVDFGFKNQHLLWRLTRTKRVTGHKRSSYHTQRHFLRLMSRQ